MKIFHLHIKFLLQDSRISDSNVAQCPSAGMEVQTLIGVSQLNTLTNPVHGHRCGLEYTVYYKQERKTLTEVHFCRNKTIVHTPAIWMYNESYFWKTIFLLPNKFLNSNVSNVFQKKITLQIPVEKNFAAIFLLLGHFGIQNPPILNSVNNYISVSETFYDTR